MPLPKRKNLISGMLNSNMTVIPRFRRPYHKLAISRRKELNALFWKHMISDQSINQLLKDHNLDVTLHLSVLDEQAPEATSLNRVKYTNKSASELSVKRKCDFDQLCEAKDMCLISDDNWDKFKILSGFDLPSRRYCGNHRHETKLKVPKAENNKYGKYFFIIQ
jgi:hypothetical protein